MNLSKGKKFGSVAQLVRPPRRKRTEGILLCDADRENAQRCARGVEGFATFCAQYVVVTNEDNGNEINLHLWPGQTRVVGKLVSGAWPFILKTRQVGFTTVLAAYVLWRVIFSRMFVATVVNQSKEYAFDFVHRVRLMLDRLPRWMQPTLVKDNESMLRWEGGGRRCEIRSFAGSERAGRSLTGNVAIFDEASRIPYFGETLAAIQPSMTRSAGSGALGQIIVVSTSAGPAGPFRKLWQETYGLRGELLDVDGVGPSGFTPFFVRWDERPGRDEAWRAEQKQRLSAISPVADKWEHPNTIDEAWEHAAGRVYPLFTEARNVGTMTVPDGAERCRLIDWGETKSAFVVLWAAHIKGPPGLLVDPACVNTIREHLGYRFDDSGRPVKEEDHTCDALRYGVVRHRWKGLVYVYREIYKYNVVEEQGWNPMLEIDEIHRRSGWAKAPERSRRKYRPLPGAETFDLPAVADRALGWMIKLLNEWDIPCLPSATIKGLRTADGHPQDRATDEKIEGLRMVSALIDGSQDLEKLYAVTREERALSVYAQVRRGEPSGVPVLQEAALVELARSLLR